MQGKDAVTREQIIKWYRLSEMDDLLTESRIAMLGDFAIFARAALATAEVTDAIAPTEGAHRYHSDTPVHRQARQDVGIDKQDRPFPFVMCLHDVVEMWNATTADSFEDELMEFAVKAINFYKDAAAPSPKAPAVDALTTGAVPIAEISALLNEAMARATENGADSRSMPDEYVAIALFTCYPERYGYVAHPASEQKALTLTDEQREAVRCGMALLNREGHRARVESLSALLADRGSEQS